MDMRPYDKFSKKNRRLTGYDYRLGGLYFITICTKDRLPYFGEVKEGVMELSDEGIIARDYWLEIPAHKPQVFLGEFVVMPNHVHGIIGIETATGNVTAGHCPAVAAGEKNPFMTGISPKSGSISQIIGSYKSACTKMIRCMRTEPFAWQDRFHDRIIRNQQELQRIEDYILANPEKWPEDKFFISKEM